MSGEFEFRQKRHCFSEGEISVLCLGPVADGNQDTTKDRWSGSTTYWLDVVAGAVVIESSFGRVVSSWFVKSTADDECRE